MELVETFHDFAEDIHRLLLTPPSLAHTGGCAGFEGASVVMCSAHEVKNANSMGTRQKTQTIKHSHTQTFISWLNDYGLASASTHPKSDEAGFLTQFTDLNLELRARRYDQTTKAVSRKTQIPVMRFFSLAFFFYLAFFSSSFLERPTYLRLLSSQIKHICL